MWRTRKIHVCSCENYGVVPVKMTVQTHDSSKNSIVIPEKFRVHVFCVYIIFYLKYCPTEVMTFAHISGNK